MEERELKIFRELDDKLYLISENNTYKKIFSEMDENIDADSIQGFIDKLAAWYFIKYSNKYIALTFCGKDDEICNRQVELMSFDKLICRLNKLVSKNIKNADLYYKQLIIMAGWKLIYFKETLPEYGYFRVERMFEDFNKNFNFDLNINIYDCIMNANYSSDNPEIINLLNQKKERTIRVKRGTRIKKLFRR